MYTALITIARAVSVAMYIVYMYIKLLIGLRAKHFLLRRLLNKLRCVEHYENTL